MVTFGPLAAEIGPVVWGTPANFNGFCIQKSFRWKVQKYSGADTLSANQQLTCNDVIQSKHKLHNLICGFTFKSYTSSNLHIIKQKTVTSVTINKSTYCWPASVIFLANNSLSFLSLSKASTVWLLSNSNIFLSAFAISDSDNKSSCSFISFILQQNQRFCCIKLLTFQCIKKTKWHSIQNTNTEDGLVGGFGKQFIK